MGLKNYTWSARQAAYDASYLLALTAVLRPAADFLPGGLSRAIARVSGIFFALRPSGLIMCRRLSRSLRISTPEAFRTWVGMQARPLTDFVALRRILRGKEDLTDWEITERNADDVNMLRKAGSSFVVATGHYCREAFICGFGSDFLPLNVVAVVGALPKERGPYAARTRVAFGQLLEVLKRVRPKDLELFAGDGGVLELRQLVRRLRDPGTVVVISPDATWSHQSSHRRPFASQNSRAFATGTAALGRLSQCPIVPCIPVLTGRRHVTLEWGNMIPPPPIDDVASDVTITDDLLDHLELAVGERPDQYVVPLDSDRLWNREEKRWV